MTAEELRQQVNLDAAIEVWLVARGRVRKGPTGFGFIPVSARKSRGN